MLKWHLGRCAGWRLRRFSFCFQRSTYGARTYTWDAENRLVGIGYPGVSGKATSFTYDGLGRRIAITSTPPGGGSSTTTSYLWCGSALCQARDAGNAVTREYLTEGEYVPGTTPATYYYGPDQIGSVRRVFASTASAPAFSYDPYGVPLQTTTPVTDFTYAGMFTNADSGLDLTQYRAYDPVAGRWLSRDLLGEASHPLANLYPYVDGDPVNDVDPVGACPWCVSIAIGAGIGAAFGAGTEAYNQIRQYGQICSWGQIGAEAAVGAIGGAVAGGFGAAFEGAPLLARIFGQAVNGAQWGLVAVGVERTISGERGNPAEFVGAMLGGAAGGAVGEGVGSSLGGAAGIGQLGREFGSQTGGTVADESIRSLFGPETNQQR